MTSAAVPKIELRKIRIIASHSEETTCFSADVWVDGKKVGSCMNDGQGGCNRYYLDPGVERRLSEYAQSLPPLSSEYGPLDMDLDLLVSNLLDEVERRKEEEKFQKQAIKLRAVGQVLLVGRTATTTTSVKCAPNNVPAWKDKIIAKHGEQTFTVYS